MLTGVVIVLEGSMEKRSIATKAAIAMRTKFVMMYRPSPRLRAWVTAAAIMVTASHEAATGARMGATSSNGGTTRPIAPNISRTPMSFTVLGVKSSAHAMLLTNFWWGWIAFVIPAMKETAARIPATIHNVTSMTTPLNRGEK
jgi:hypothetical protein